MNSYQYKPITLGESVEMKAGEGFFHESADLRIWVRKTKETVDLFSTYSSPQKNTDPPTKALWKKQFALEDKVKVGFLPAMPDLPVQLTFNEPLFIPGGSGITFYYLLPTWVSVRIGKQMDVSLGEFHSFQLSHTWDGNFFEGELVYEDFPEVFFEPKTDSFPYFIIVPIEIKNKSNTNLLVIKQIIRVDNLSIYNNEQNFWANRTLFEYGKSSELLDVKFIQNMPKNYGKFTLVQKSKSQDKKSILTKYFDPIKMKHTLILPNR